MKLRIGIYTPDSDVFPNLAAMQISAYHQQFGDEVILNPVDSPAEFDLSYGSVIFPWTDDPRTTFIGGPKYSLSELPQTFLNTFPDYSLYPEFAGSVGYTYRGCPNRCWFCDNHRFPKQKDFRSIWSFHPSWMTKLTIFDVNFIASPWFELTCDEIILANLDVCIPNGIDARRITPQNATKLSQLKLVSHAAVIDNAALTIAWDTPADEPKILSGIKHLQEAGFTSLRCYVLLSSRTTEAEDLHRVMTLVRNNVQPVLFLQDPRDVQKVKVYNYLQKLFDSVSSSTITFQRMDRADFHVLKDVPEDQRLVLKKLKRYGRG